MELSRFFPDGARSRVITRALEAALVLASGIAGAAGAEGVRAASADTTWFGGRDPATGLAVEGGVWDFSDCTAQGWHSIDLTAGPVRAHHVTPDSHAVHGDPAVCAMTVDGSQGSVWFGTHEDEARYVRCWPGGQGYGDDWRQQLSKSFVYGGSGPVTLSFDYFTDSETYYDFLYVYVTDDEGVRSPPLNGGPGGDFGYSGSVPEGTAIGSPTEPAHAIVEISPAHLPDQPGESFQVLFEFVSDFVASDDLQERASWVIDTVCGAFGVDNIRLQGVGLDDFSDFEPGSGDLLDGWVATTDAEGSFMGVRDRELLDYVGDTTGCELQGCVLFAADTEGQAAHPKFQHELLISNAIPVREIGDSVVIRYDSQEGFPFESYTAIYRPFFQYHPWTCPETGAVGWSLIPDVRIGFFSMGYGDCQSRELDWSFSLPTGDHTPDSLRLVLDITVQCPWGQPCPPDSTSNQSPYFDNIRVGLVRSTVEVSPPVTPAVTRLELAVLNPFSLRAPIRFALPRDARVTLSVIDVAGARVRRLLAGDWRVSGRHEIEWDGRDDRGLQVSAGVYFIRLEAGDEVRAVKVVMTQ